MLTLGSRMKVKLVSFIGAWSTHSAEYVDILVLDDNFVITGSSVVFDSTGQDNAYFGGQKCDQMSSTKAFTN